MGEVDESRTKVKGPKDDPSGDQGVGPDQREHLFEGRFGALIGEGRRREIWQSKVQKMGYKMRSRSRLARPGKVPKMSFKVGVKYGVMDKDKKDDRLGTGRALNVDGSNRQFLIFHLSLSRRQSNSEARGTHCGHSPLSGSASTGSADAQQHQVDVARYLARSRLHRRRRARL